MYSKLPGFPSVDEYDNGPAQPRLENPYDTMGGARPAMQFSDTGVYSNPGEVTSESESNMGFIVLLLDDSHWVTLLSLLIGHK